MICQATGSAQINALFGKWEETILWSCLQGMMGSIYTDDLNHPSSAMAALGDFAFFAGEASAELLNFKPCHAGKDFIIMIPQTLEWKQLILKQYGNRAKIVLRYATKKEPEIFEKEKLNQIVASLPQGYELNRIDKPIYEMCKSKSWSADLVSQFPQYEDYRKLGLGAVIQKNRQILSGASSYSRYQTGIEIEIDTHKEFRRRGFARICGAKLILECLKQNLYPSWDAQNEHSLALAKELGYHYSHTYEAIEIWGY